MKIWGRTIICILKIQIAIKRVHCAQLLLPTIICRHPLSVLGTIGNGDDIGDLGIVYQSFSQFILLNNIRNGFLDGNYSLL